MIEFINEMINLQLHSSPVMWYSSLIFIAVASFGVGYLFICYLRHWCKLKQMNQKKNHQLTTTVFIVPIILFIALNCAVMSGVLNQMISDAVAFGTIVGILLTLSLQPTGPGSVKLVVQQVNGKNCDVWLDTLDMTVGEVRVKIAETMEISPNRIAVESGKGNFIEDLSRKFTSSIDDTLKSTDFFGFITLLCFVTVKEDEMQSKKAGIKEDLEVDKDSGRKSYQFLTLLQKQIKYGDLVSFSAKIAGSAESRAYFTITAIEKFAAAAPNTIQLLGINNIRLHSWQAVLNSTTTANGNGSNTDGGSDVGDVIPPSSHSKANSSFSLFGRKKVHAKGKDESSLFGKPVCSGDIVVIEFNGNYMSVAKNLWLAWSSPDPRRSGAFIIDITEKATHLQNKLKEQFEKFGEKMGVGPSNVNNLTSTKEADNILRPGDMFRLRSVKFPEYELGLTSVKIKDEFCYLGLRKIKDDGREVVDKDGSTSMGVRFTLRS